MSCEKDFNDFGMRNDTLLAYLSSKPITFKVARSIITFQWLAISSSLVINTLLCSDSDCFK